MMTQPKRFEPGDRVTIITGRAQGCRGTVTADNGANLPVLFVRWDHMKGLPFPPSAVERKDLWKFGLLDVLAQAAGE